MEFKQAFLTIDGKELMAKIISGEITTQFTKLVCSSHIYDEGSGEELTELLDIEQEAALQVKVRDKDTVLVESVITNDNLEKSYYVNTIGIYAMDPDKGEILYSVALANVRGFMSGKSNAGKSALLFQIYTKVGNTENIIIEVDPTGAASKLDIRALKNNIIELEKIMSNDVSEIKKEISNLGDKVGLEIKGVEDSFAILKTDITEKITKINDDLTSYKKDMEVVVTEIKGDISEIKKDMTKNITEIKEDITTLRKELTDDISKNKKDIKKNKTDIEKVETDLTVDITKVKTDLTAEIKKIKSDIDAIKKQRDLNVAEFKDSISEIKQYIGKDNSLSLVAVDSNHVKYIIHQGYTYQNNIYPENSIRAFKGAKGNYGVGADLRVTLDGELVCLADYSVDRTTNGKGEISKMNYSDVKKLNLLTKFESERNLIWDGDDKYSERKLTSNIGIFNQKIPTIEEFIKINIDNNSIPFIQIRVSLSDASINKLESLLNKYNMLEKCCIQSSDIAFLKKIRNKIPDINLQFISYSVNETTINSIEEIGNCGVCVDGPALTRTIVDNLHIKKIAVGVKAINDNEIINQMIEKNVDYITTNNTQCNNRVWRATDKDILIEHGSIASSYYQIVISESSPVIREIDFTLGVKKKGSSKPIKKDVPIVNNLPAWCIPSDDKISWLSGISRDDITGEVDIKKSLHPYTININGNRENKDIYGTITTGFPLPEKTSWVSVKQVYYVGQTD